MSAPSRPASGRHPRTSAAADCWRARRWPPAERWYRDPHGNPYHTVQAAAAALYVVPVLVIFLFAQRHFIRSIVTSGMKG